MIVDELVVVLGLDARQFNDEQRAAVDAFRRSQQEFERTGKAVEHQGTKIADVFSVMRKGALGVLGAFIGGEAASFVDHVINMDANTGRFARTIGGAVENLGTWQALLGMVGGNAGEANTMLLSLRRTMDNFASGMGDLPQGMPFLLSKIQGDVRKMTPDQILQGLGAALRGEISSGETSYHQAGTYLSNIGISEAGIAALLNPKFNEMLESARKVAAVTKENTDAAEKLQAVFSQTVTAAERFGSQFVTGVEKLLEIVSRFLPAGVGDKIYRGFVGDGHPHNVPETSFVGRLKRWLNGESSGSSALSSGGTRGDRNNNPGNMKDGPFARAHGATGSDGAFAVFPDYATGSSAQEALVRGSAYRGLTLDEFARKYAEGNPAWEATVGSALGLRGGDVVNNQDPRLIDAIRRAEGTGARGGAAARVNNNRSSNSTSTSTTHIGKVEVHTQATDAEGIAADIGPAIKRSAITAPANTGLV